MKTSTERERAPGLWPDRLPQGLPGYLRARSLGSGVDMKVAHFADRATALKARKAASMAPQFKTIRPQDEIGEVWADYLKQIGRGPWDEVRRSYQRITGRELVLA